MSARKKVLLKIIILGDSGLVFLLSVSILALYLTKILKESVKLL